MNLRHKFELSLVMERLKCIRQDEEELFEAKRVALADLEGVLLRIASEDNATGADNDRGHRKRPIRDDNLCDVVDVCGLVRNGRAWRDVK